MRSRNGRKGGAHNATTPHHSRFCSEQKAQSRMSPRDVLRVYDSNPEVLSGESLPAGPLPVEDGERVGVVMFNLGGPASLDEVELFLYQLFMDPAFLDLPVGRRLRRWLASAGARLRAGTLRRRFEMIGGESPLPSLAHEQADALERRLNAVYGAAVGAQFRTYPAMRYSAPFPEEAAARMEADDVDKVVLLPAFPQYSAATTGSALAYWAALRAAGERPSWPTTAVPEYAAHPKFIQSVSERIDEALQRFPEDVREQAVLVFSAQDTAWRSRADKTAPYCCQVSSTVQQVLRHREDARSAHTAFHPPNALGTRPGLSPSTPSVLEALAQQGCPAALVVPISILTDHVNTAYDLDISLRAEVEQQGIDHFEVTAALNTHPLLIDALGEAVVAQLHPPTDAEEPWAAWGGQQRHYPLRPYQDRPRLSLDSTAATHEDCDRTEGARGWTPEKALSNEGISPKRPATPPDDPSPSPDPRSRERS